MVQFQCIHCGARIAVHERYMDRLACCPECGGMTHPLAEHLVKREEKPAPAAVPAAPPDTSEEIACANCGSSIGKLQKPLNWEGKQVCAPCHRLLSEEKAAPKTKPVAKVYAAPAASPEIFTAAEESTPMVVVARPRTGSVHYDHGPRLVDRAADMAWAMRGKIFSVLAVMLALYLIVMIIRSLSVFLMWAAGLALVVVVIYWIRRGILRLGKRGDVQRGMNALRWFTSRGRR